MTYTMKCPDCGNLQILEYEDLRPASLIGADAQKVDACHCVERRLEAALAEKDARIAKLEAENARLREALSIIPPDRIHLLITFLDLEQSKGRWGGSSGEYEIQNDLRRLKAAIRATLPEAGETMNIEFEPQDAVPIVGDTIEKTGFAAGSPVGTRLTVTSVAQWVEPWGGVWCGDKTFIARVCFDGTAPENNQYRILKRAALARAAMKDGKHE